MFGSGPVQVAVSLAVAATILAGGAAGAQVIEIQPGGDIETFAGPVRSLDGARQAIAPSAPAPSGRYRTIRPFGTASAAPLAEALQNAADRNQLSARLMEAVAWQESRFSQAARSPKGARGVMQLMPETARRLAVDPGDLYGNIEGGAAYMARLLRAFDGDIMLSLAAYNAGPEAVRRWGGVPPYPETRAFVAAVFDRLSVLPPANSLPTVSR